jgi:cysteine sulfinate desulfinase/cysteine desulfurase-like protein
VINPIKEIAEYYKSIRPDGVFHSDIVQTFGKENIPI